jgi:hypothetical protein
MRYCGSQRGANPGTPCTETTTHVKTQLLMTVEAWCTLWP